MSLLFLYFKIKTNEKNSFEKLNDGFINLYEEGIFVRCFEYSAVLLAEITGYRLFANINKKTGFIFLEVGFPKNKLEEIVGNLENRGYFLRITDKNEKLNMTIGNLKLERIEEKLKEIKNNLIKL